MRRASPSPPDAPRRLILGGMTGMVLLSAGLARADDPRIAMLEAIRLDDANAVRRLLAKSVSPNLREKTHGPAIVMAAKLDSFRALALLAVAPGVDLEAVDASGQTALMMAAIKGHAPSVKLLLDRGARVDSDGWTALHYAASGGHAEVARMLILRGANLDARSANGTTPVMLAARNEHFSTMELLADMGADLTARNDGGRGVIEYLEARNEHARIPDIRERIVRRRR